MWLQSVCAVHHTKEDTVDTVDTCALARHASIQVAKMHVPETGLYRGCPATQACFSHLKTCTLSSHDLLSEPPTTWCYISMRTGIVSEKQKRGLGRAYPE
eukprot:1708051-Rhodomonas_salina.1